jgi:hypothetical protein
MPLVTPPNAPARTITSSFSFDRPKDSPPTRPITTQNFIRVDSEVVRPVVKPRFAFTSPSTSSSSSIPTNKRSYADSLKKPTTVAAKGAAKPVLGSPVIKAKKVKKAKINLNDFVIDSSFPLLVDQEREKRSARESRFQGAQDTRDAKEYHQSIINKKAKVLRRDVTGG